MDHITCAFTGHRPKSFPWKDNETDPGCILLKETLAAQISALEERGVTEFLSGMAQGVDLWAAEIVLDLKKKNPVLHLYCILPCEGQEEAWPMSEQERYRSILQRADEIIYVNREYTTDCMLVRNRYLVEHSSVLLAVYNGTYRSGTGMTVRYAQKLGRKVIIIDPVSKSISREKVEW